jgi:hypothetical protein
MQRLESHHFSVGKGAPGPSQLPNSTADFWNRSAVSHPQRVGRGQCGRTTADFGFGFHHIRARSRLAFEAAQNSVKVDPPIPIESVRTEFWSRLALPVSVRLVSSYSIPSHSFAPRLASITPCSKSGSLTAPATGGPMTPYRSKKLPVGDLFPADASNVVGDRPARSALGSH